MKKKPDELLAELPEGIVEERLKTFGAYYKLHFEPKYDGIFLNLPLLRHALERSMLDILYFKKYHGIGYPDRHKRAAFPMWWIARVHPIQLHTHALLTDALIVINEVFGVHLALSHLEVPIAACPKEYVHNLIYSLHNRVTTPVSLAAEMYLLECAVKNEN